MINMRVRWSQEIAEHGAAVPPRCDHYGCLFSSGDRKQRLQDHPQSIADLESVIDSAAEK